MNNPELINQTPSVDELSQNPGGVAKEILDALKSGNLSPHFVESHLAPILNEARNVNNVNTAESNIKRQEAVDTIKQNLLVKLAMLSGEKQELFETLKTFCNKHHLDLFPKPNWNVRSYHENDFDADWYSQDGKFALTISDDMIFVFKKYGDQWVGEAAKYE